jgi:uncharacterized membrane protein
MKRIANKAVNKIDLFKQGVKWRVTDSDEEIGSLCGAITTILIVTVTLYYAVLRYLVLRDHGDRQI